MKKVRGFTMIELLIAVVIIGILATIVVLNLGSARARSVYAKVVSDMSIITTAARLYDNEKGAYPEDAGPNEQPGGLDQYLNEWPVAPCNEKGWTYDWNAPGGGSSLVNIFITFNDSSGWRYHNCTKGNCTGNQPDPSYSNTSIYLPTMTDKKIFCN